MAVSRDDQNTFLMIGGVLIICLIALIAVISSIWALIRQPVNAVLNSVSTFVRIQTLDYNFALPTAVAVSPTPTPGTTPIAIPTINLTLGYSAEKDIDYNFPVATSISTLFGDALYTNTQLKDMSNKGEIVAQKDLSIQIPSINVNSPILQGLDSDTLLKQGFWVIPSERKIGESEVIMVCNRRFFGPSDPKSCWFLDKITKESTITLTYNSLVLTYKVVGINRFSADDPLIYKASDTEDLLRIVTTDPLESNANRLVVLAERVK
ncbi:MAG: sortase [Candidatus Dojkabacteria bacterium]